MGVSTTQVGLSSARAARKLQRRRRTNKILIGVSVVFFFSWAPLNFFNIVDLFVQTTEDPGTQETLLIFFTIFHFFAMSSVCSNPIMLVAITNIIQKFSGRTQ